MDIADRVQAFLSGFYSGGNDSEFKDEYQKIFAEEGFRKTASILNDLELKQKEHGFSLKDVAYLSIGGADGSEAEAVLLKSEVGHAVVLEIDKPACDKARERALRLPPNKALEVFEGDAVGRLDDAITSIQSRGAKALVVSAQAILHELPARAPSFTDFNRFFGKVLGALPLVIFYAREPCKPYGWPSEVEVQIPGVAGTQLKALLEMIGKHLQLNTSGIEALPHDYVICNDVLAVETLHKLLRCRSLANFKMEMGEQLTSFDVEEIRAILLKHCVDPNLVDSEQTTTQGFRDAYAKAQVNARDPKTGGVLQLPKTHARIFSVCKNEGASLDSNVTSPRTETMSAKDLVRRGRIDSQISFSTIEGFPDGIRVVERSTSKITEFQPNPYFQFGGTKRDIFRISKLTFSLQLGPNSPTALANKIVVLNCDARSDEECAKLLAEVTEERTVPEDDAINSYVGLRKWVPLQYVKSGVQLITEAEYVVQKSRLFTWRVGVLTEGYDLSIHYPSQEFDIQIEPFINWTIASNDTLNEKRYRSDDLVRPENGVAWCFLSTSKDCGTES